MRSLLFLFGLVLLQLVSRSQNSSPAYASRLADLNIKLAHEPGNLSLYYGRAEVYRDLNDFHRANNDYKRIVEMYRSQPDEKYSGEYAKSCYRLADDYFFRNSRRQDAMRYVAKGLQVSKDFKDLEVLEAVLLGLDEASRAAASEKYRLLTAKYPDDVRLRTYYARFLKETNPLEAAYQYEKVLEADPFNKEILLSIGTIYNNEAYKLSSAVVNDPKQVYDLATKAALYFERLYKMNPADKEVANLLLRLYDELDEQQKASQLHSPY